MYHNGQQQSEIRKCCRHFKSATKAIRQQEILFETEKNLEFVKTQKWSELKIFTSWDRNFIQPPPPPPIYWKKNQRNPRLRQTARVTSKLLMDPTNVIMDPTNVMDPMNVIASDPQVWLLALKWCKIGVFWYFVIYC